MDVEKRIHVFLSRVLSMRFALKSMVYNTLVLVIKATRPKTMAKLALPSTTVYLSLQFVIPMPIVRVQEQALIRVRVKRVIHGPRMESLVWKLIIAFLLLHAT